MEIWINSSKDHIQIPIIPSEVTMNDNVILSDSEINGLGSIVLFSGTGLSSITLTSFFPNQQYSFASTKWIRPGYYVEKFKRFMDQGEIIRLIITTQDINMNCIIESFSYGERDGTGDIYYSLTLREYRRPNLVYNSSNNSSNNSNSTTNKRPISNSSNNSNKTKIHVVKSGDTLWLISKKYYGTGDKWKKIHEANKKTIKNPNILKVGQKLVIP